MRFLKTIGALYLLLLFANCGGTDTGNPVTQSGGDACDHDLKICPDNSTVERDPLNHCEFKKCPGE